MHQSLPPKNISSELVFLFYRLKYQKSPSWFYGLSESEIKSWRKESNSNTQINTLHALKWVLNNPKTDLTKVIKSLDRSNDDIHLFCKNFVGSLELTGQIKEIEQLTEELAPQM
jgi:hypothetical protein